MIRFQAHILPPPLTLVSSTGDTQHRKTEKERQLADGMGVGEEPNHTTARKPVPLSIIKSSLERRLFRTITVEGCVSR
jgi:hypothetical protein